MAINGGAKIDHETAGTSMRISAGPISVPCISGLIKSERMRSIRDSLSAIFKASDGPVASKTL